MIYGNRTLTRFDTIVVGSGAGGSAIAGMLAANGQKVLVLEAGTNYFVGLDQPGKEFPQSIFSNDELKFKRRRFIMPDPTVEPRSFRRSAKDGDRRFIGDVNPLPKIVGGGAVHADLKTPRFLPTDFRLGTLLGEIPGAEFADWSVGYDELEPFYTYAEYALGVQGIAGSIPGEGHRSAPYPMPPGVPMYAGLKLTEAARKLGYHPFDYPSAVNSRPYGGRPACIDCGFCGSYGCPTSAKNSTAVTMLRSALLSGNCQLRSDTRVSRLIASSGAREVTGVEVIGPDGGREVLSADRYVLAASPIEDARLLFLSDPQGPGLGNSSGRVGRDLLFHFQTIVTGIFEERMHTHRGRVVTNGMADFRGVPGDPDRPLGGIIEFGATSKPIEEAMEYMRLPFRGKGLKRLLRESPFRDRMAVLTMQGEDAPQASNRIDLDPSLKDLDGLPVARITYQHHKFELAARKHYAPKMLKLLKTAGAHYGIVAPIDEPSQSFHVMGTLRFGDHPSTSVCNRDGRLHDVGNVYCADGALFPTSSGFNPTLTLIALASRVGAAMIDPRAPERAIPKLTLSN